ncbi:p87 [Alphabaculovirus alterspexiguae]|uniref:p87 n=1 Tax=Spodoptera exigua multiple nucleopolyhedrovirus TaxID=10454 RepID=A0A3G2JTT2_9ABAC|nr:p87 [Spodoptera exigua multiple nucleopolyhedrovirus]AYN45012.1 p87 [Spodoptera exigua multiple nucleopolyhedrovirus]
MNIENVIEDNSFDIKFGYARLLADYVITTQPEKKKVIDGFMKRISTAEKSSKKIAKFSLDNVVHDMNMIISGNYEQPSTSGTQQSMELDDDDTETVSISSSIEELSELTVKLLTSNTLQSLSKQSLLQFKNYVDDNYIVYEDIFTNGIDLSSVDCELNDDIKRFIKIYSIFGEVRCVEANVEYFAEIVRKNPKTLESLPPTVREAVVTILDLVQRKEAYTTQIYVDPIEYNKINDNSVKALFNRYSEHTRIQFRPMVGADNSSDEEANMTQTMRRKRKMRQAPPTSASKSKRIEETANNSDETFIENIKQMHKPNTIVPALIMQIVKVVPNDVASSMLTCPTNGLSEAKISVNNYSSTISLIDKMNLTVITENVYFFKLLEPLTYYGTDESMRAKVIWFIARAANYFIYNAKNYVYLRKSLSLITDDADRVALFLIRYNFLWFYRQFLNQILSMDTTPYQNQKILNVLHVYASVVQKEYNSIHYDFNQNKIYVGPVDNVVKLMVVSLSDILA